MDPVLDMRPNELARLTGRLERLERQCLLLRSLIAVMLLGVAGAVLIGVGRKDDQELVRTRRLEIIGPASGKPAAVLTYERIYHAGILRLYDDDGRQMVSLCGQPHLGDPDPAARYGRVAVYNKQGREVISLMGTGEGALVR